MDTCLARARELAHKAPQALAEAKRLVHLSRDWTARGGPDFCEADGLRRWA